MKFSAQFHGIPADWVKQMILSDDATYPDLSKRLSTASVATYRIKNNLALMGQASNLS